MASVLLATKLHIPPVRPQTVPRPRLIERLNAGLHRKLTLISAPAGYGKTTLAAEWLRGIGRPCAWLSLDEEDNDPTRFLAYLLASLQRVAPNLGESAQAGLRSPRPSSPESTLTALINDLAAVGRPFLLVLDDYHLIHTLAIHQQLAFLLEHQPAHMHLVIATREDPPLPLSRLRARGQMTEVRQADLGFSEQEAAGFLQLTMGLELSPADIATLCRHTEGWIAGLQLAALSIRESEDVGRLVRSFAGSHPYILDYLAEEVFQRQPAEMQRFLLSTSVLERLTVPLCDAVAEHTDSREMLRVMESGNLFLVPLDESRQWYRYHQLFASLLRHRLQLEAPDLAPSLHRRASLWYENAGYPEDAVHHALAAGDWGRAIALIGSLGSVMLRRGETMTIFRWYQALPETETRRPQLAMDLAWVLVLIGQFDAAEPYLAVAEAHARDGPAFAGSVAAARGYIARVQGDDRRAIALSEQALAAMPATDYASRSVVVMNLGIAHWHSGHLTEAERAFRETEQAAAQAGNLYSRLVATGFLGVIQATKGKLHHAREIYEQAIHLGQQHPPVALAHNELAALLYEWDDLGAAAHHLHQGLGLSQRSGNVEIQNGGYRMLALLRQAQGEDAAALEALEEAYRAARDHGLSSLEQARIAACHVQIALARGDMAAAVRWAERIGEDADASPFYPLLGLTQARLLLAQDRVSLAIERLAACAEKATREGWRYGLVATRALQCVAAPTYGEARRYLAEALALAEPEGYIRTLVDLGKPMAELLQRATGQGISRQYVSRLLSAFGKGGRLPAGEPAPALAPLITPLTDRERDTLRLLAQGQTNEEIARAMVVSVNTVKVHLKNVYGKLGVNSRRQAIAEARKLGLLPPSAS